MKKIDEISFCGDCSHRYWEGDGLWCEKQERQTTVWDGIPSWCPLPDAVSGWRDIADAAGTAATALAEVGYDAVEVFRALPDAMKALEMCECYPLGKANRDLLRRIKGE